MKNPKSRKIPSQSSRDYAAIAQRYAEQVAAGEIPACKWHRLSCERHLNDLRRDGFEYHFDAAKASAVCEFIENLPHVKGKWNSATLRLEPWQVFILCVVFGWLCADGARRFRTAYTEVPRKNAKSTLSSGVGLYLVSADGEPGAEVYSLATTRDQARIVFDDARQMAKLTPALGEALGLEILAHAIAVPSRNSTFRALSADANTLDGLNIHGAIVDEFHAHQTRAVWDVVNTATGARRQALKWIITTAGYNRAGVCYEQRNYVCKVLEGTVQDDRYFGIIFTIDDADDWTTEEAHRKANPNYGVSVLPGDISTLCRQAMLSAQSQNNFLTKRLNVWVSADAAYFNMQAWDRCRADVKLDEFAGRPCYMGLDLAAKHDLTAKMLLFERDGHTYLFGVYYLPEDEIEQGMSANSAHYAGWARAGKLTLTPGNITDYEYLERDIIADCERFDVQAIVFDPYEMTYLHSRLQAQGVGQLIEYPVNVKNYSDPMKAMDAAILAGTIHHDGDPVLAWAVSNVVAHTDAKDMVFPRKERPENKIDPVTAALGAYGWKMRDGGPSVYEKRGVIFA